MIITIAMIMIDLIIVGRIVITVPHEVSGSAGSCSTGNFVGIWEERMRQREANSHDQQFSETRPPQPFCVGILWE
jgi:hypothetical protein